MLLIRAYQLAIYANHTKLDTARYTYERYTRYVQHWVGTLFFNKNRPVSTAGLGNLANQSQRKAQGIIRAMRAAQTKTGAKTNIPHIKCVGCPAKIVPSGNSFDYWLSVESQFGKRAQMPVRSHRKLNTALREGWVLNPTAEFFKDRNGRFYARVFVQKDVARATPRPACLGVDVGYRHGACRSDGHIGTRTDRVIAQSREKRAQRQRQGLKSSAVKTRMKQLLDREAKQAVNVCRRTGQSLAVEDPKRLANLRSGKLHGWAKSYFANRCQVLGKEQEVFVLGVNPAYTSQTCSRCQHKDPRSRDGVSFVCTACGYVAHADVNAARNIATKGTVSAGRYLDAIRNRKRVA